MASALTASPPEPVGQSLLGRGRDGGHHPFRIHRTTDAVYVPARQDVERAGGQQPVQIAEIREVRPRRLRTVGADVRHAQPVLHTCSEEVHQATAVVRHVTVHAARVAPDAGTPSGAGATERAHPARLHLPECPATAPRPGRSGSRRAGELASRAAVPHRSAAICANLLRKRPRTLAQPRGGVGGVKRRANSADTSPPGSSAPLAGGVSRACRSP